MDSADPSSELRLRCLALGDEGTVAGYFDGRRAGWVEFVVDRSGPSTVTNTQRPSACQACGFELANSVLDKPGGFASGFASAAEIRDTFARVVSFQETVVAAIESSTPGLRQLGTGLRDRVSMFTPTHHYAVLSALVQGQFSGVVENELSWSFGRWVSGELGCVDNKVGWPWQIASHVAPSWNDRPREPGVGFMDLTRDESDAAIALLIDLVLRFCDHADAWASATGVARASQSQAAADV